MPDLTEDLRAIREALEAGPRPFPGPYSIHRHSATSVHDATGRAIANTSANQSNLPGDEDLPERQAAFARLIAELHPGRISRIVAALEAALVDAERWRAFRDIVVIEDMARVIDAAAEFWPLHVPAEEESRKAETLLDRYIAARKDHP